MRKKIFVLPLFLAFCVALIAVPLYADEEVLTLLPNARHAYRFDYRGDRSQIDIVVEAPEGVELAVYEPARPEPVGRGTRRGGEIMWSGKFPAGGVYRATVENTTPGPIQYSIAFLGEGVSGVSQIIADAPASGAGVTMQGGRISLALDLPTGARRLASPSVPENCTSANALPQVISSSLKLCANEIYPPLRVVGNGIGLFADDGHTAVINSAGRQFAVNVEGQNNWIEGVVIQSAPDAADDGAFLCQYDECVFPTQPTQTILNGGLTYGGGILVNGSNTTIHGVTVRGGTIGVATVNGANNVLVENNLSDLNGWGSFNLRSHSSVFVGNRFDRNNHGCTTPDGNKFEDGCETAGWVCLQCANNLVVRNHCEASGNCYYMSGERGLGSNNNRFVGNYCAASPNNCFEFTFSQGNVLQDNIATAQPVTGAACKYPFWIGGSTVYFGQNTWSCAISPELSIQDAVRSTNVPTVALALGNVKLSFVQNAPPPTRIAPTVAPSPTPEENAPRCKRKYRPAVLLDWDKLQNWVECLMTPL